ncbi:MAG TPA: sugar ABC transporter substrate-binding protein [Limnochordia bacterium]
MAHRTWGWLLAVVAALGCATAAAAEEIVWWNWDPPAAREAFQPAIDAFTAATGIEVRIQTQDWGALKEKLILAVAGGVAPDVTSVSSIWAEELADQGVFVDLNPLIKSDRSGFPYDDIFPASYALWQTYDGKQYAMPFDNDIQALFYNKGLFDAAGVSYPGEDFDWETWLTTATALTRDVNGDQEMDQFGFVNWWFEWLTLIWANGGALVSPDRTVTLNTPAVREALRFYGQFFETQRDLILTTADSKRMGYPHPAAAWKAGHAAMAPAGAWMPTYWIYDEAAGRYNFEFDVAHMPLSPAGKRATINEGQGVAMLASTAHPEAAFRFLKHLAGEQMQTIAGRRGQFPVRRSIAASAAFLPPNTPPEHKAVFVEVAAYARPAPHGVNWAELRPALYREFGRYFSGDVGLEEAIVQAETAARPILNEARAGR